EHYSNEISRIHGSLVAAEIANMESLKHFNNNFKDTIPPEVEEHSQLSKCSLYPTENLAKAHPH
ncbi:hypothetical protein SOVF_199500, partial [Spinacia oleracea]